MYPSAELISRSVELLDRGEVGELEWRIDSRVGVSRKRVPRLDCVACPGVVYQVALTDGGSRRVCSPRSDWSKAHTVTGLEWWD